MKKLSLSLGLALSVLLSMFALNVSAAEMGNSCPVVHSGEREVAVKFQNDLTVPVKITTRRDSWVCKEFNGSGTPALLNGIIVNPGQKVVVLTPEVSNRWAASSFRMDVWGCNASGQSCNDYMASEKIGLNNYNTVNKARLYLYSPGEWAYYNEPGVVINYFAGRSGDMLFESDYDGLYGLVAKITFRR